MTTPLPDTIRRFFEPRPPLPHWPPLDGMGTGKRKSPITTTDMKVPHLTTPWPTAALTTAARRYIPTTRPTRPRLTPLLSSECLAVVEADVEGLTTGREESSPVATTVATLTHDAARRMDESVDDGPEEGEAVDEEEMPATTTTKASGTMTPGSVIQPSATPTPSTIIAVAEPSTLPPPPPPAPLLSSLIHQYVHAHPYVVGETADQAKTRRTLLRQQRIQNALEAAKAAYDPLALPSSKTRMTTDPYNTLFIYRLPKGPASTRPGTKITPPHPTALLSSSTLAAAFKAFGPVRACTVIKNTQTGLPRGYAFVEFADEESMKRAYRDGEGMKVYTESDGGRGGSMAIPVRVSVDVERGRTVKGWLPRRLGGGLTQARRAVVSVPSPALPPAPSSSYGSGGRGERGGYRGGFDSGGRGRYDADQDRPRYSDRYSDSRDRYDSRGAPPGIAAHGEPVMRRGYDAGPPSAPRGDSYRRRSRSPPPSSSRGGYDRDYRSSSVTSSSTHRYR